MSDTLFYSPDILANSQLPEIESHHCIKVLRMRIGDSLKVTDGKGHLYQCTLVDNNAKRTTVSIINQIDINQPKDFTLHVAVSASETAPVVVDSAFAEVMHQAGFALEIYVEHPDSEQGTGGNAC